MIGYGLVNSAVHEICLNQIIVSFLSRSSIFLANFYLQSYIRQLSGLLSTKQQDDLVNLFLEEEKYIAIQKNIENPDPNFNQEEIVYKYLLTANIISNKDYNYDLKTTEQVINDGKIALKNIFFEIYQKFLSNLNQDVGNILKLPDFEKTDDESKNFLLNLIKYSTFIFMNYSVAKENGDTDLLEDVLLKKGLAELNEYGRTSYSSMASEIPDIEYDYANPKQKVFNYFTSAGKFFNYGEIKPLLFGEFYYSIKQDKINDFMNDIYNNSKNLENMFSDFQLALRCTTSDLSYKYLQNLGYFKAEDFATEIITYAGKKYFTLSKREILKYYKFSFPEIYNIVSAMRLLNKNFEDYFNLGFRLNLNLNADITKDQDLSNHHIYELFNIPFKKPESGLGEGLAYKIFNKYPPFYENLLFRDPQIFLTAEELGVGPEQLQQKLINPEQSVNLLYNSFFVNFEKQFEVETGLLDPNTQKPLIKKFNYKHNESSKKLYRNLLKGPGIGGSKLPKDNPLFKMLFSKENLLLTINNYDFPQFKINYFITIADFIVNTENQNIYFSAIDDPKEAQFLIKKTYYQTVLNQLLEIKDSSDDNNIKYILDSYKFDELKKLSEQYDNFKPTSNYKVNMDKIYDFYNGKAEGKSYNLLTIRDTSLKILDAQIKVLENG